MAMKWYQKLMLGLAGLTAAAVGGTILASPQGFYDHYGVDLHQNTDLLSELRASSMNLLALGLLMIGGVFSRRLAPVAVVVAPLVFLAYAAGRGVGVLADGMPSSSILGAMIIEVVVAVLCLLALRQVGRSAA